ncbi:molybdopterin-binding protein [Dyella jiangningensis]|nr:molybdopterin-binding protein [Dyella jiangningensis]
MQIRVAGQVLPLNASVLAGLPHIDVIAAAHDEAPSTWRGVSLVDLLLRAGVALDKPLRGRDLASSVRVTAADNYQIVFALSDLDPTLGHGQVLLVEQRNGKPLDKDGPYRLLVPGDKRPARWVRNVTSIEVVDGATSPRP